MDTNERARRFIHTTAIGSLIAFGAAIVCISIAIIVLYSVHDPYSLIYRYLLLVWLPFAIAMLCMVGLALAAGVAALRTAPRGQSQRQFKTMRLLLVLAVLAPVLLVVARHSAEEVLFIPAATLLYLVLPALALLFTGARADLRLLALGACAAYGLAVVLLLLAFRFPRFGMDPNQNYFFYLPPQLTAALFALGAGAVCGLAAGVVCAVDGRWARRHIWSRSFQIAVIAGLIGPVTLELQTRYPPILTLSPSIEVTLTLLAGASYLALPVLALVYLRKPSVPPSSIGAPYAGASL